MGKLLYEVKGGGQGQAIAKSEVSAAADAILQPLMDLLDGITNLIWSQTRVNFINVLRARFSYEFFDKANNVTRKTTFVRKIRT